MKRAFTAIAIFLVITMMTCPIEVFGAETIEMYKPNILSWSYKKLSYTLPEYEICIPGEVITDADGVHFLPAERMLKDMGFTVTKDNGVIRWRDAALGDFWIEADKQLVHGPELLYKFKSAIDVEGMLYVPVSDLADACYWTYSQEGTKLIIERLRPTKMLVDKTMQVLTIFGKDANGNEKPMRYCIVTTGKDFNGTPNGTFKVNPLPLNARNRYFFRSINTWIKYCSQLYYDICIHTTYTYSATNLNTSEMHHGYDALGNRASNGCIRMLFSDARFIYYACGNLPVTIEAGKKSDEIQLIKDGLKARMPEYKEWIKQMLKYEPAP